MKAHRSVLAFAIVAAALTGPASGQGRVLAQAGDEVVGTGVQAMIGKLMLAMGLVDNDARQGITAILVGFRAGDIAAGQAIDILTDIEGFKVGLLPEIAARARIVHALDGNDAAGVPDRAAAIVQILTAGNEARRLAFSDADVYAVLAEFDRGQIDVAGAIDRLSRLGGTEPMPFYNEPLPLAGGGDVATVLDIIGGAQGNDRFRREDVEAAIDTITNRPGN